ncbi:hypothetical protein K4K48_003655 [Colletotrichum sp. SAR 10_66]|nr:hypothetical protein K4K51_004214 [Colletotrichum sp. SAR 10_75]KAI8205699.1 hypothetical protein K4K52_004000 [Colletotrichum sp. SAR 10_76]KAJ4999709.1 hypothetical protein K4K48_003655 [Colletotrichum sp. SAR 10_66]
MSFAIQGGNKEVVEFLLDNGINVNTTFGGNQTADDIELNLVDQWGWTVLHRLAAYGTDLEVRKSVIFETDERGWTLLHVAASAGHRDITQHLLEAGSNPYAESRPFFSHIPESIWGQRCTPAKVAAAQSRERLVQYEELLEELGIESAVVLLSDGEEQEDEFWDAVESIS